MSSSRGECSTEWQRPFVAANFARLVPVTLNHRELYRRLLSPEFRDGVIRAVNEQGYPAVLGIRNVRVVDTDPHPHLHLELEPNDRFVAASGGLFLDLANVIPDAPSGRYYMPYVGTTPRAGAHDVEHELRHLDDLLRLIEVDPDYVATVERLGVMNAKDPSLLEPSIRVEVKKLFWLEVPAFKSEYDANGGTIDVPLALGHSIQYKCASRDEYVTMWLSRYVESLRAMYLERFPSHGPQVDAFLAAAVGENGAEVLGPRPWETLMGVRDQANDRIVAQVLAGDEGQALRRWVLENARALADAAATRPHEARSVAPSVADEAASRVERNREKRRRRARRKGR